MESHVDQLGLNQPQPDLSSVLPTETTPGNAGQWAMDLETSNDPIESNSSLHATGGLQTAEPTEEVPANDAEGDQEGTENPVDDRMADPVQDNPVGPAGNAGSGPDWDTDTVKEDDDDDEESKRIFARAFLTALMGARRPDFSAPPAGYLDAHSASSVLPSSPEGIVGNLKAVGSSVLDTLVWCASTVLEGASSVRDVISSTAFWKAGKDFFSSIGNFINPIDAPHGSNFAAGSIMTSVAYLMPETYQLPFFLFGLLSVAASSNCSERPSEVMKDMQEQSAAGQGREAPDGTDILAALLHASILAGASLDGGDSQYNGGAGGFRSIDPLFRRDASLWMGVRLSDGDIAVLPCMYDVYAGRSASQDAPHPPNGHRAITVGHRPEVH